jgi:phosphate transport system permease protein
MSERSRPWRDRTLDALAAVAVLTLLGAAGWLIADLLLAAWPRLSWGLFSELPRRAGRAGGISSILVATGLTLVVCWALVLPVALGAAIALSSSRRAWTRWVHSSLDLLSGLPSIVLGMFGMLFFGDLLGLGFSIACGGLTLACMILPLVIRVADTALRAVPSALIAQAAALGLSRTTTLTRLILPQAMPGLLAACGLGTGRALAETAALVFTSGGSDRMPSGLENPGRTIAVHIYELAMNVAGGDPSAAASALILILCLIGIQVASSALLQAHRKVVQ